MTTLGHMLGHYTSQWFITTLHMGKNLYWWCLVWFGSSSLQL